MPYKTPTFSLYFGDEKDAISKKDHCIATAQPLINHAVFKPIADRLEIQQLALLNQTHSVDGFIVKDIIPAFNIDGDYLITQQKNIGLGVMTADCLPIVFYDTKNCAAIAHAGWRGSIGQIAVCTIKKMQEEGSQIADIQVFLGPSAKVCCYEVNADFVKNIPFREHVIVERNSKLHFDLPGLNIMQLKNCGIKREAINTEYNFCTICNHRFFSYRRQGENAGRQMTVIALH